MYTQPHRKMKDNLMKRLHTLVIFTVIFSSWLNVAAAQNVEFPDANLAAAVREVLGLAPNAPITRQHMQGLDGLFINDNQITNLTGLEHATELKVLGLGNNQISDIRPLAGLTQLTVLGLNFNQIRDVSPLAGLTQLTALWLNHNQISDIRPLAGLTQLQELYLGENQIRDVNPLTRLTQLEILSLYENQIRDIRPIGVLTQVRELSVRDNRIQDVSPLRGLTQLQVLYLGGNQINNIASISGLRQLRELSLYKNQISDIRPIGALTQLRELSVRDNRIQDVSPLRGLTQLQVLYLSDNRIQDVTRLARLTELKALALDRNQIRDVSPLAGLVNLEWLRLAGNPITDTSPLVKLTKLTNVDIEITTQTPRSVSKDLIPDLNLAAAIREALGLAPNAPITKQTMQRLTRLIANNRKVDNLTGLEHATQLVGLGLNGNQISDISPLAGLTQLVGLGLGLNQISDISPLAGLTQLEVLELSGNQISDISPLVGLTQLEQLYLPDNQISDISPLSRLMQLEQLRLQYNQISDIQPLSGLTQLTELWLGQNDIRDVSPLSTLVNLGKLYLAQNPIQDTSPLANLTKLVDVDVEITLPSSETESVKFPAGNQEPDPPPPVPIYWTDPAIGKIQRANLGASNVEDLVTGGLNGIGIALDVAGGKMYWTDPAIGKIQRANLDGSNVEDLLTGLGAPLDIALDIAGGKMYWTHIDWNPATEIFTNGKIQRANLDGSNVENLLTGLGTPSGIALDIAGGKMYWTDPAIGKIQRANLDSSNVEDLLTGLGTPSGIALDIAGGKMYWTHIDWNPATEIFTNGKIQRANLDGSNVENLLTGLGTPSGIALDVAGGKMYWTHIDWNPAKSSTNGKIQRANLDGSNVEDLLTGLGDPASIALGILFQATPSTPDLVVEAGQAQPATVTPGQEFRLYATLKNNGTGESTATTLRYYRSSNDTISTQDTQLGRANRDPLAANATIRRYLTVTAPTTPGTYYYGACVDGVPDESNTNNNCSRAVSVTVTAPPVVSEDVNEDGVVDVQDLVYVAQRYGQTATNTADVNEDGVVNIDDLILVAKVLESDAAAAPSLHPATLELLTVADVKLWLSEARQRDFTDPSVRRGILFLEQLLAVLTPKETTLLANYPNPFNPETWIPYQLAKPADVTLSIYAVNGTLVRRLALGHQRAGRYQSRSRAAYWDGRNELGEPVASGVYFYTLTVGDFTATRKMLIMK